MKINLWNIYINNIKSKKYHKIYIYIYKDQKILFNEK